jgi:geranylgeranylglycerol-phosphate geranylgeranyltransferase
MNNRYSLVLRGYITTMRPYLAPVSGSTGLVGLALGNVHGGWLWASTIAFFASYGFGQALTDVFQTDTDSLSAPYRPLVRGELDLHLVMGVSMVGLLACAVVFMLQEPWTLVPAALGTAGLATYTPMKRHWWGGPPWNSAVVALLPVIGAQAGGVPATDHRVWLAAAAAGFTYATFVLIGYLKDIDADRATGYQTLPVVFGRGVTVVVSAACGVLGLTSSLVLAGVASGWSWTGLVVWASGALLLAKAHWDGVRVSTDAASGPAAATSAAGCTGVMLGLAALIAPDLGFAAALLFGGTLAGIAARPHREQA